MSVCQSVLEKIRHAKKKYYAPLVLTAMHTMAVAQTSETVKQDTIPANHEQMVNADRFAMFREAEQEAMALLALTEDCKLSDYNCGVRQR